MSEWMVDELKNSKRNNSLIVFAGAGVSKYLGLPSWKELVIRLYKRIEKIDPKKSTLIPAIEVDELDLLDALKHIDSHKANIYDELKKSIDVSLSRPTNHQLLWSLSPKIITTNYDRAFEIANSDISPIIHNYNFELSRIKNQENFLLKIHGTIQHAESCVLFEEDFKKIYSHDSLAREVFEDLIKHNTFLFIGFSMADPYISAIFEFLNNLYKGFSTKHFLLATEDIDLLQYNIHTIKLANWNESFIDFIEKINGEKFGKDYPAITSKESLFVANTNNNRLSDYPKPNILFTGRSEEIKELQEKLNKFRILAIEGLGGTGKTQFAAKCVDEVVTNKNKIVWLDGSSQSRFDVFIQSAGYGNVLKGDYKSDKVLYNDFKDLIERDERIIFWDNFNDYEDPAFSEFLAFAHQYLQKASIVLITRTDPSIAGITFLPIVKLEGLHKDAIEYAIKLKYSNPRYESISNSDLEKICIGTEGHPLAIEFAMWLMGYGKKADEITANMPDFSGIKKVENFSKRLFLDIFNHPRTSEEERDCLLKCSVFKGKILEEAIEFLYNGKNVFQLLAGLIDKLLINHKAGFYEIHPLVRSFSYEKLADKKGLNRKAAKYFISKSETIISAALEEKIFYHLWAAEEWDEIQNTLKDSGKELIRQGHLGLVSETLNKLSILNFSSPEFDLFNGEIAQIKGEWDRAITYFEKASSSDYNSIRAEGIIKHGEILYRRGDAKESLPFFEKGYQFAKEGKLRKQEARALNDIGLVYYHNNQIDLAYERINTALKIRNEIGDLEGVASCYNNFALIFFNKNQISKALEYARKSIKIVNEIDDKPTLAQCLVNAASFLRMQKKYDLALIEAERSLEISRRINDKATIASSLTEIGTIFLEQNEVKNGLSFLNNALTIREEIGEKKAIAQSLSEIGRYRVRVKQYQIALFYLAKALSINRQIGNKSNEIVTLGWINEVVIKAGLENFKTFFVQAFDKLPEEMQRFVSLKEFLNETVKRESPKIGRNDPCTCGSGKKYKNCHGKTE